MKRPNKPQSRGTRRVFARLAAAGLMTLERALSTAQSLWSQHDRKSVEQPKVHGCRNCGLIYEPRVYFLGSDVGSLSSVCPKCCSPRVEYLGPLPFTTENSLGVYLIGDLDEPPLGPFKDEVEARHMMWEWFDQRKQHAQCEGQEARPEGKVIRFIPKAQS